MKTRVGRILVEMGAVLMLVLACMMIGTCPAGAQPSYGEQVGTGEETEPISDGFGPFVSIYQCPATPLSGQDCLPGHWYIGSLFGDTAFDRTIDDAAQHQRFKGLYESEHELLVTTQTEFQTQTDLWSEKYNLAEEKLGRAERSQPILFGVGLAIGVVGSVLVVALLQREINDSSPSAAFMP